MAWNQPGGQNNSPWGRRPGQGGADLDERVRGWQRKLESLLRPGRGGHKRPLWVALVLLLLLWLASGLFQVKSAERGIVLRFGKLAYISGEGLHLRWPWPIESVTKVDVDHSNSSPYQARVLTSDINLAELRFTVQYKVADPIRYLFKVHDPEATLSEVSASALREVVGRSTLDEVLVGTTRPQITQRAKELIQRTLDDYDAGILITSVNLTDVQVPEAVVPSQRDANKALADEERTIKEAQAYVNSILPEAEGEAATMQQKAQAYHAQVVQVAEGQAASFAQILQVYNQAPEVTRRRLYMDAVEAVLSQSHKVVIDQGRGTGGNGSLFYLPLDKLLEKSVAREPGETPGGQPAAAQPPKEPDSVTVEAPRARGER
jgi:membrane protease subunit HflK